ncbi:MAG: hypothetical protein EXX96DRAFT_489014 [Benjaminiella poitrasii]|nr:MAG: hypothetical protein EXX96DRAFT_489014 [Benjaminiella poitrasii]
MPSPVVPPLKEEPTPTSPHEETNQQLLVIHQKPVIGVISEPPSLRTAEDFAHMPTLQALHILRLQLKLGSILGEFTTAALLPTALQRVIPHDIRIDYVPGASIRDRMIMFQGYYNMDDCFQQLTRNTCFVGGDIRDTRNWVIDPMYSLKFWFLSHQLVEQNYGECLNREDVATLAEAYVRNDFNQQQMSNDDAMAARFDKYGNNTVPLQSVYLNGIRK